MTERIGQLMEERRGLYEAAADITVDTTDLTVDEVVVEIIRGLEDIGFWNDRGERQTYHD